MDPRDSEPLLRQLAQLPEPEADLPADELLHAYRRGGLPPEEVERLERWLARSPEARLRLVALAELADPNASAVPSERVRDRVLASFVAARGRAGRSVRPKRTTQLMWAMAAAAVLVLGLGLPWLYRANRAPLPSYHLQLSGGQAQARGGAGAEPAAARSSFPEQEIRLLATPEGRPEGEVEIGLYRVTRGRLERVDAGGFAAGREGATLARPAAALAGDVPGQHPLYFVAARPGDLPENGAAVAGDAPDAIAAALADGGRRRVSALSLTILEDDPSFPVRPRGEQP